MLDGARRRPPLWLSTIVAVAGVDLCVRFVADFELERVLWVEAALFLVAGGVILRFGPRNPTRTWQNTLHLLLAAAFMLGGLRAGLWAAGLPVAVANATIFAAGVIAATVAWLRGRKVRQR